MSWQDDIYQVHLQKTAAGPGKKPVGLKGIIRQSRNGGPNKTETRFENEHLKAMQIAGLLASYAFESITLKLANGCKYTPDWVATFADPAQPITFYEIKGKQIWDDAIVKLKVAADKYPYFHFYLCAWDAKTGWTIQRVFPA
jgi:hypothetical protein